MLFSQNMTNIINVVGFFSNSNDELQATYAIEIAHSVANNEIEIGRWANQIGAL